MPATSDNLSETTAPPADAVRDGIADLLASPETFLDGLAEMIAASGQILSLEASALFLAGAIAAATGGRVLLAVMGVAFLLNISITLGVLATVPDWIPPVLAMALFVAIVHQILAVLLSDQTAGSVLAGALVAIATLLLIRPLALLRIPGLARLLRNKGRR
ncbi:MAG: hypothetical protein KUG69_12065 [Marinosulfonomonas sp.]|nr:hypothetical protein [Marinosulfonomonas sp.]